MTENYYTTLEISNKASARDVKSAYRRLARRYHPDVGAGSDEERFKKIANAYEVLGDIQKRAQYDRLGHDAYVDEKGGGSETPGSRYHGPPLSEILEKLMSTRTPFDRFVRGYPSVYLGGTFEDPYTEDHYSSAEDIRIAKAERVLEGFLRQIENLTKGIYPYNVWSVAKMREVGALLNKEGWLSDEQYKKSCAIIDKYERERPDVRWPEPAVHGSEMQDEIERGGIRKIVHAEQGFRRGEKRKNRWSPNSGGQRDGADPDKRHQLRREVKHFK